MNTLSWILLGVAIGVVGMVPAVRLLLRRAEDRARLAERRARESERLAELGAMTGGLAHEIKNPLSTIALNAQLLGEGLSEGDLDETHRERLARRLESLAREVDRLKGILTDFLQFAGRIRLEAEPHDLVKLVNEVADFFHPQCDQASVLLRTHGPDHAVIARVDEGLLKQALLNLMINAVQAMSNAPPTSGAGGHEGATRQELILRIEDDPTEARLHVIDTGPGIDPQEIERVFHPYVSSKSGGTGLGLPTARRIVEEHGGRLIMHSEPGRGSDFVIHLPL